MIVNTKIGNVLKQILNSRLFDAQDLRNIPVVVFYLRTVKEDETADWVEQNPYNYLQGLLSGFEIDNSQEAQINDIKTGKIL